MQGDSPWPASGAQFRWRTNGGCSSLWTRYGVPTKFCWVSWAFRHFNVDCGDPTTLRHSINHSGFGGELQEKLQGLFANFWRSSFISCCALESFILQVSSLAWQMWVKVFDKHVVTLETTYVGPLNSCLRSKGVMSIVSFIVKSTGRRSCVANCA